MADDLLIFDSTNTKARIAAAAAALIVCTLIFFAIRWQLGSMVAELNSPTDPEAENAAELAVSLAPSDPLAVWLKTTYASSLAAASPEETVKGFENTIRLSPLDYRWWIELGRALEQAGQNEKAEASIKKAVTLAPNYAYTRWQLGNFYLRQNRVDEAIAELRIAASNNETFRQDVFSLGWDYFNKDAARLDSLAVESPDSFAGLAYFYAVRGRAADALRIWNQLTDDEKASRQEYLKTITQGLFEKRHFAEALDFARQLGTDPNAQAESFSNGGFERTILSAGETRFGWQILRNDSRIDVSPDTSVRKEGSKSLKVSLRGYNKPDLFNISQIVVVQPGQNYRIHFWVRTENLKSAGPPQINIIDAGKDSLITASKPFSTGTNDWQQVYIDFRSPDSCTAITVSTGRAYCGDDCPVTGIFWYDAFEIERR